MSSEDKKLEKEQRASAREKSLRERKLRSKAKRADKGRLGYRINKWAKANVVIIALSALFSALCLGLGIYRGLNGYRFDIESTPVYSVKNEEDFYKLADIHSVVKKISLEANIEINKDFKAIGDNEMPFNSIFVGNGYTLAINSSNHSIFNIIGSKGRISNLEVSLNEVIIDDDIPSFGAICNINNGKISDVNLKLNRVHMKNACSFGGICSINNGEISYSYVEGLVKNEIIREQQLKRIVMGGATGFNNGILSHIISRISYDGFKVTSPDNILAGNEVNTTVGSVYGVMNHKNGSVADSYYIYLEDAYLADSKSLTMIDESFEFDEIKLLETFNFNSKIWRIEKLASNSFDYIISLKDGVRI